MTLASPLTISTCARQGDEPGLITPSLNILSTLSWINNRSSRLKRRDLVVMGFTPAVRLENKLTSRVTATDTAQVSSCKTTVSWRLPPNSKMTCWCRLWKSRPRMVSQQSVGRTFSLVNAYLLPLMHTCYLTTEQFQSDKIPATSPSLKSISFELDAKRDIKLNWVCCKSMSECNFRNFPSRSTQLKLFHQQLRE